MTASQSHPDLDEQIGRCEEEGEEKGRTGDTDQVAAIMRDVSLLLSGIQTC